MGQMLRCKQCDGEMTLTPLPPIEGEEHGLHMKIDGLPALRCSNGHTRFVAAGFPSQFLDSLLSAPDLVPLDAAAEKGFLRKRYCCPACGQALDTQDARRVAADHSMPFDGLQPVAVHVDLPAYRCAACGHECVEPRDTLVSDLMKASAHAFRSAQIAPG
ncbi:MAG: hypothetical protein KF683_19125 [Rubrivivax sp.]|nr:hypothetical protein [Rubrivivax sp.]